MNPTEEEGWVMIRPEDQDRFRPIQARDQVWDNHGRWNQTENYDPSDIEGSDFSHRMHYRRRVELCTLEQIAGSDIELEEI